MSKATATTGTERYKTTIKTGTAHQLIADEPAEEGGRDTGAKPTELLAASLASCSTITMKMYADRKDWPLEEVNVSVEFEHDPKENHTKFVKNIVIKGDLEEEQKQRIYKIASKCPVHRILENSVAIDSKLSD